MNITSNVVVVFNIYLIFGIENGEIHILNVHSKQILAKESVCSKNINVILTDNFNPSIIYVIGKDGKIAKCKVKKIQYQMKII